ncbi:MAG: hypothetical protein MUE44_27265, partial [Oscillatoriaceae cyanobacterium Prado104]|nr:hypothetical protein [Oscillatoriaceae cyanobacterium Prado104]
IVEPHSWSPATVAVLEWSDEIPRSGLFSLNSSRLLEIMKGKHFATAVSGVKNRLTSEIYKKDFGRNERCHSVIWECAQNMTYPDFYQAWHTQPTPTN